MRIKGFDPYFGNDSVVLILGSFPSVKSREQNFYYGHRQNRFWKIIAEFFDETVPVSVEDKKSLLARNKLALWDIVTECEIIGSQDNTIKNYDVADIPELLTLCPSINKILLNGKTAAKIFAETYPSLTAISRVLPSTSPANPRFDKSVWFDALKRS